MRKPVGGGARPFRLRRYTGVYGAAAGSVGWWVTPGRVRVSLSGEVPVIARPSSLLRQALCHLRGRKCSCAGSLSDDANDQSYQRERLDLFLQQVL